MDAQEMVYDQTQPLTANSFTRTGYVFSKWTTSSDGSGDEYTNSQLVSNLRSEDGSSVTLYAQWTANTFTVSYNKNGGEGTMSEKTCTYDANCTLDTNTFTRTGYNFTSWKYGDTPYADGANIKNIVTSGTVELKAQWAPISYTITFDGNGSTSGSTASFSAVYDTEYPLPASGFARTGYTQNGWKNGEEIVAADASVKNLTTTDGGEVTLKANWVANAYTIAFEANGGTGEMSNLAMTYDEGKALAENAFTKTGYHFDKWTTAADGTGNSYTDKEVAENLTAENGATVTLYAQWIANEYTIEYEANGGTNIMSPTTCTYDAPCALSANSFEKTGYVFDGWKNGDNTYTDGQSVNNLATQGIVVLVAQWAPITYTIRFNANDGTGSMSDITVTYDDTAAKLPANAFERNGFSFDGWYTSVEDGSVQLDDEDDIPNLTSENGKVIVLYAKWEALALVCKAATELHVETCDSTGSCKGLTNSDISGGEFFTEDGKTKIRYGNIPSSNSPKPGDAYDCDVNNDGTYDKNTERFYAIANNNGNIDLIYYNGYKDGPWAGGHSAYSETENRLPTKAQWSNPGLVEFEDGKISSNPLIDELIDKDVCNTTMSNSGTPKHSLRKCVYVMENTVFYHKKVTDDEGPRSGIWMQIYNGELYRAQLGSNNQNIEGPKEDSSANITRPIIRVPRILIETIAPTMLTVSYNTHGDDVVNSVQIEKGTKIGDENLPSLPNRNEYVFEGWSTTEDGNTIDGNYIVNGAITLHAVFAIPNVTAIVNDADHRYNTLQNAINAATTSGDTVILLKDVTEKVTVASGQNITLNLHNHAINSSIAITNNGSLKIENGTITNGSGTSNVIVNDDNATMVLDNVTLSSNAGSGAINNDPGAMLTVKDCSFVTTGSRQAIYNDGATLRIEGNTTISSSASDRAAVHNRNGGTATIKSGTITSTGAYAVYNEGETATLIIGTQDGVVDTANPTITGKTWGVVSHIPFSLYDGTIRGKTYSVGYTTLTGGNPGTGNTSADNTNTLTPTANIEVDTNVTNTTDGDYTVRYLEQQSTKYRIDFDGNGGTSTQSYIVIDPGEQLGELPSASRPNYDFDDWWTDPENGEKISSTTTPTQSTTYYAHWTARSSDEIVTFYTPSNAAKNYFNNISTWSANIDYVPYSDTNYAPSTSMVNYWQALKSNYENNHCQNSDLLDVSSDFQYKYTSGTIKCDQPNVYDTGVNGKVNVFLSDENTKTKNGTQVAYTKSNNGTITNMIPGTTYYWESDADSSIYGYVKATGERRFIATNSIRNVRDLGGISAANGKAIKYGVLMRGEKLRTDSQNATDLTSLGITKEYDLRGEGASDKKLSNFLDITTRNYYFNLTERTDERGYYADTRNALESLMRDVVAGEKIYFHCTYGADRTGSIAFLVEALLGVSLEDRIRDYELTTLAGESDRTRIYDHKKGGSFAPNYKFIYMLSFLETENDARNWFKAGLTTDEEKADADTLIEQFRNAVLE